ncbi:hypothetical protein PF011_g27755 [Phytophthora fragariae]|uniref:Uncharacterized protein n=1 Tax=Phytophthora fragariae TaxID=53985 RepID=A0A6A3HD59_9STRA|nr:hypothetical protein PF011_g27755 [Phytophthora fragariae]
MAPCCLASHPLITALPPPEPFEDQDRTSLTRAWIAVAEEYATQTSTAKNSLKAVLGRPGVFWDKVQAKYSGNCSSAEELLTQWQQILRPLTEFLQLFEQKYFESRPNFRYDGACVGQSFKWATVEFRAKTGAEFPHLAAATQLTSHNKWWSVLKPLVLLQQASSVEQEEEGEDVSIVCDIAQLPPVAGAMRARSEDDDEMTHRRVRQRLDLDSPRSIELPMSPFRPQSPEFVSPVPQKAKPSLSDDVKLGKVMTMERRLDLDIMTQSEHGLSAEAVEYLRWQRQQILRKMREGMNAAIM